MQRRFLILAASAVFTSGTGICEGRLATDSRVTIDRRAGKPDGAGIAIRRNIRVERIPVTVSDPVNRLVTGLSSAFRAKIHPYPWASFSTAAPAWARS